MSLNSTGMFTILLGLVFAALNWGYTIDGLVGLWTFATFKDDPSLSEHEFQQIGTSLYAMRRTLSVGFLVLLIWFLSYLLFRPTDKSEFEQALERTTYRLRESEKVLGRIKLKYERTSNSLLIIEQAARTLEGYQDMPEKLKLLSAQVEQIEQVFKGYESLPEDLRRLSNQVEAFEHRRQTRAKRRSKTDTPQTGDLLAEVHKPDIASPKKNVLTPQKEPKVEKKTTRKAIRPLSKPKRSKARVDDRGDFLEF